MLTASEAAAYLDVHVKTVRSWADKGQLPATRWPNGWQYFRRSDLDEMRVKLRMQSPQSEAA